MDNDREIDPKTSEIVERSKMIFLREMIDEFKRKQSLYDPATEFAKTRKNRSLFVPLTVVILLVLFGTVVFGVTRYIQQSSRNIAVDIEDFADVNLRDLLDGAKRIQVELDQVRLQLRELQEELDRRIRRAEAARDREIRLAREADISPAARDNRISAAEGNLEAERASIEAEFAPRIAELEARIVQLEEEMARYDSRQLEAAREQEEILNNQQRVFELQLEEQATLYEERIESLTENYELQIVELQAYIAEFEQTIRERHRREIADLVLRYNPIIRDGQVAEILALEAPASDGANIGAFRPVLAGEGVMTSAEYTALLEEIQRIRALNDRLSEIPFENDVPAVIGQLGGRTAAIIDRYDAAWRRLADSVEARDRTISDLEKEIARYEFSLNRLSLAGGDTGFLLDTRDEAALQVYVNPLYSVESGTVGYVFRRDDEYIGTIRFYLQRGRLRARVTEVAEGKTMQPYDKVLIEVQ